MGKAYRLTMDYNTYSFQDLRINYSKNNTATWYIESSNPKILDDFQLLGKNNIEAFFYCCNMPDRLNRFVFKGKIVDVTPNKLKSKTDKKNEDCKTKIIIGDIKVFNDKDSSLLAIRNGDGIRFSPRGTYGELNEKVYKILSKIEAKEKLEDFLDRFTGCNCIFENFENKLLCHSSFTKENNEKYVEFHHIIFRNFGYSDNELLKILDSYNDNYVQLCPACHRAIHYGNKELRKKMIDKLLKQKGRSLEKFYYECLKNKTFKEKIKMYNANYFKDFIYKIYKIYKIE